MDRILAVGFVFAYCGVMGALVALTMPLLDRFQTPIQLFVVLPSVAIGVGMIIYAHAVAKYGNEN